MSSQDLSMDKENSPVNHYLSRDDNANQSAAQILAKKLYEDEKRAREERKRKRDEDEAIIKKVRTRVDDERKKLEDSERTSTESTRELYSLFNDLQGISLDFNIEFNTPEFVVVGMQSDGKSSFIEGLLGFQFNIVESTIGTRRPLILQMVCDPSKTEPYCRFRKEDLPATAEEAFEADPVPASRLSSELLRRTNAVAGKGDTVNAQPIILRVEYMHCANITIYDTPGFRLGGDERIRLDIQTMVRRIMEPPNRIIVCLEQSTVEWANTTSRPIVREIDRDFARTVLINTKFDNRVKELRDKESAEKYLQGENLPPNKRPFFISMPLRRGLDPVSFAHQMKTTYLDDFSKLLECNVDEKYLTQVGFARAKGYLEKLLHEKYLQSITPTLQKLESLCRGTEQELARVAKELENNDLDGLKVRANKYVLEFNRVVEKLLLGSIIGSPEDRGQTLSQEREGARATSWPGLDIEFDFPNAQRKLYGGAQYHRLLREFEYVAHSREFPPITINEVAAASGISKSHTMPIYETAASDIVQHKARQVLQPLLEVILQRVSYVFKRLFHIAVGVLRSESDHNDYGLLGRYDQFCSELQRVFSGFIEKTERDCREKLKDDFDAFTKIIDWDLLSGVGDAMHSSVTPTPEETKARVLRMLDPAPAPQPAAGNSPSGADHHTQPMELTNSLPHARSHRVDEDIHQRVSALAGRLFAGIRFFFVKYVCNKVNAFFLDPMYQKLNTELMNHFRQLDNRRYEEIFQLGIHELQQHKARLEAQYVHCCKQRDRFKEVASRLRSANAPKPVSQLAPESMI